MSNTFNGRHPVPDMTFTKHRDGTVSVRMPQHAAIQLMNDAGRVALDMQIYVGSESDMLPGYVAEEKAWRAAEATLRKYVDNYYDWDTQPDPKRAWDERDIQQWEDQ